MPVVKGSLYIFITTFPLKRQYISIMCLQHQGLPQICSVSKRLLSVNFDDEGLHFVCSSSLALYRLLPGLNRKTGGGCLWSTY